MRYGFRSSRGAIRGTIGCGTAVLSALAIGLPPPAVMRLPYRVWAALAAHAKILRTSKSGRGIRRNKSVRSGPLAVTKKKFPGKHRCHSRDRAEEQLARDLAVVAARSFAGARQRQSSAATSSITNSAGFPREQPEPCGLVISPVLERLRRSSDLPQPCLKPLFETWLTGC